ncbi:MAG: hypothetical protein WCO35_01020 [Candidatus Nomurabacteria bacterium]
MNSVESKIFYNTESNIIDVSNDGDYNKKPLSTNDLINILIKKVDETTVTSNKAEKISKDAYNLTLFGFLVLLVMVAGLILSGYSIVQQSSHNENDYNNKIFEYDSKISKNENDIKNLKICLSISKWLNPKCLDN